MYGKTQCKHIVWVSGMQALLRTGKDHPNQLFCLFVVGLLFKVYIWCQFLSARWHIYNNRGFLSHLYIPHIIDVKRSLTFQLFDIVYHHLHFSCLMLYIGTCISAVWCCISSHFSCLMYIVTYISAVWCCISSLTFLLFDVVYRHLHFSCLMLYIVTYISAVWCCISSLTFQLFDVVYREETLLNVIRSVTRNGRSIILTAVLALILVYMFSIIGYMFFKDDFLVSVDQEMVGKYHSLLSDWCVLIELQDCE